MGYFWTLIFKWKRKRRKNVRKRRRTNTKITMLLQLVRTFSVGNVSQPIHTSIACKLENMLSELKTKNLSDKNIRNFINFYEIYNVYKKVQNVLRIILWKSAMVGQSVVILKFGRDVILFMSLEKSRKFIWDVSSWNHVLQNIRYYKYFYRALF